MSLDYKLDHNTHEYTYRSTGSRIYGFLGAVAIAATLVGGSMFHSCNYSGSSLKQELQNQCIKRFEQTYNGNIPDSFADPVRSICR